MIARLSARRDVWAGVLFAAIGLAALVVARDYPMGDASQMGPGYFPICIGAGLVMLGLTNVVRGLREAEPGLVGRVAWRPFLLLPLSVLVFGLLIDRHGLVVAIVALVVLARIGGGTRRPVETVAMCIVLATMASALFVYGLGLPLQLVLPQ